jgi:hypothetical protein
VRARVAEHRGEGVVVRGRGDQATAAALVLWRGGRQPKGVRLSLVHPLFHTKLDWH